MLSSGSWRELPNALAAIGLLLLFPRKVVGESRGLRRWRLFFLATLALWALFSALLHRDVGGDKVLWQRLELASMFLVAPVLLALTESRRGLHSAVPATAFAAWLLLLGAVFSGRVVVTIPGPDFRYRLGPLAWLGGVYGGLYAVLIGANAPARRRSTLFMLLVAALIDTLPILGRFPLESPLLLAAGLNETLRPDAEDQGEEAGTWLPPVLYLLIALLGETVFWSLGNEVRTALPLLLALASLIRPGPRTDPSLALEVTRRFGSRLASVESRPELLAEVNRTARELGYREGILRPQGENPEMEKSAPRRGREGWNISAPVPTADGVAAVLEFRGGMRPPTETDRELAKALAGELALALEVVELREEAAGLALLDPLTSLPNHRGFMERLGQEMARSRRRRTKLAMLLVDLDLFRLFNDIYGHEQGDVVLRLFAKSLAANLRLEDLAARYGGGTFAVLLPETGATEAEILADRLCRMAAELRLPSPAQDFRLTVSIGLAVLPEDGATAEELLERAGAALRAAKAAGRNRWSRPTAATEETASALEEAYHSTIYALAATLDAKDSYTNGHSARVSRFAVRLAEALAADEQLREIVRVAGLLHDLGKIGVPEEILRKKGRLTARETAIIREHPALGANILRKVPRFAAILPAVLHHHEAYDGSGYPEGLRGEEIPLEARILSLADAFEAMISDRPYRAALPADRAVEEIRRMAGRQFDPHLAEVFINLVEERRIAFSGEAEQPA